MRLFVFGLCLAFLCLACQAQTYDFTKYYGKYYLDDDATKECEKTTGACCIEGAVIVSAAGRNDRFNVVGNYTLDTYANCESPTTGFLWPCEIIDQWTGRILFGIQTVRTARVGFTTTTNGENVTLVSISPNGYNFEGSQTQSNSAGILTIGGFLMLLSVIFLLL